MVGAAAECHLIQYLGNSSLVSPRMAFELIRLAWKQLGQRVGYNKYARVLEVNGRV